MTRQKKTLMRKQLLMGAAAVLLFALSMIAGAAETAVVIIRHDVADYAAWKKGFDAGKVHRDKAGLTERYVLRDVDKPNFVTVVLESASVEGAKKFFSDPALIDRMKKANLVADIKIGTTGGAAQK